MRLLRFLCLQDEDGVIIGDTDLLDLAAKIRAADRSTGVSMATNHSDGQQLCRGCPRPRPSCQQAGAFASGPRRDSGWESVATLG
jgi:hypothetical protein